MTWLTIIFTIFAFLIYLLGWGSNVNNFLSWNIAPNFRGISVNDKNGGYYFQNSGGLWLHYYYYPSSTSVSNATVALIHGLNGQNEGYHSLCNMLSRSGIDVYSMEYSGWGHSEGDRGYFGENGMFDVVSDFNTFLEFIEEKQQQLRNSNHNRIICVGKSFGGLVVLHTSLFHQKCQSGMVLLAPAIKFHKERRTPTQQMMLSFVSNIFPKLPIQFIGWEVSMRASSLNSLCQYMMNEMANLQAILEKNDSLPRTLIIQVR